jgi:hypothetical protein
MQRKKEGILSRDLPVLARVALHHEIIWVVRHLALAVASHKRREETQA